MPCCFPVVRRNDTSPTSYFSSVPSADGRSSPSPSGAEGTSTAAVPIFFSRTIALKSLPISSLAGHVCTIVNSRSFGLAPSERGSCPSSTEDRGFSQFSGIEMCSDGSRQPEVRSREPTICAGRGATANVMPKNKMQARRTVVRLVGITRKFTPFPDARSTRRQNRLVADSPNKLKILNRFDAGSITVRSAPQVTGMSPYYSECCPRSRMRL